MGAAAAELARIGWRFTSALGLESARGEKYSLLAVGPADIHEALKGGQRAVWERELACKRGYEHDVCLEPVGLHIRRKENKGSAGLLLTWAAGGLVTGMMF